MDDEKVCATCIYGELIKDNDLGYKVLCKIDNTYHDENQSMCKLDS